LFLRATLRILTGLLLLAALSGVAQAQVLPWKIGIDSSFRTEFLFGNQIFLYRWPRGTQFNRFRMEFGPKLPLVSGTCEVSPTLRLSARVAGAASVLAKHTSLFHTALDPQPRAWDVRPEFRQWEVAGLVHLWTGGGYRFSFVGGFRKEFWKYIGGPADDQPGGSDLREKFTSTIPFIALQTALHFPWWKARFEFLGSPFMEKDISARIREGTNVVLYSGSAEKGGLIELDMEGTAAVGPRLRVGLHCRYTYQELYGEITRDQDGDMSLHPVSVDENIAVVGLNFTFVF
jgi:hypothetical protein